MVESIIPSSNITHSASAKTLTLSSPFNLIGISDILLIYNLTKGIEIYNSKDPRKRKLFSGGTGSDIEITNGVITYIEPSTMANGDAIQIIINIDANALSTTANLFSAQSVSASSTATVASSVYTGQLSKLSVYCSNSGASTDCTVTIYASPTSSLTGRKKALAVFTLGAGNVTVYEAGNGIDPRQLDNYIWATITNNDSVNAAVVTVTLSMFR